MMKVNVEKVWDERAQHFYSESIYYWRLIGSSGLGLTLSILTILVIIYYHDFLDWLPETFPVSLALSVLLGLLITRTSFRTLLKEADLLFLTPLESRMAGYFSKAYLYNMFIQCMTLLVVLAIFSPLYANKIAAHNEQLWFYFLIPLLLKGWNLNSTWIVQREQDSRRVLGHTGCRFLFHTLFLYWFFTGASLIFLVPFVIVLFLFYFYGREVTQNNGYHWLHLIEMEKQLANRFYRFANLFVDVPHLESNVQRRRLLAGVTRWLPFHSTQSYRFLFLKSFVRADDYLWIYLRLAIIGSILVYAMNDIYTQAGVYLVFLFLSSVQLRTLWNHHLRQFWIKLFPLPIQQLKDSYLWTHCVLISLQGIFMLVPAIVVSGIQVALILLVIGLLYASGYTYLFLRAKIRTS